MKFFIFLKVAYFLTVSVVFCVDQQNLETRKAMNAKVSVFIVCVETIIFLLFHNLHDCTFNPFQSSLAFHIETNHLVCSAETEHSAKMN